MKRVIKTFEGFLNDEYTDPKQTSMIGQEGFEPDKDKLQKARDEERSFSKNWKDHNVADLVIKGYISKDVLYEFKKLIDEITTSEPSGYTHGLENDLIDMVKDYLKIDGSNSIQGTDKDEDKTLLTRVISIKIIMNEFWSHAAFSEMLKKHKASNIARDTRLEKGDVKQDFATPGWLSGEDVELYKLR